MRDISMIKVSEKLRSRISVWQQTAAEVVSDVDLIDAIDLVATTHQVSKTTLEQAQLALEEILADTAQRPDSYTKEEVRSLEKLIDSIERLL